MQNAMRLMGAVLVALVATGCVTPYQRVGLRGGYRDMEVSPGIYNITVNGNAFTSLETLEEHFHRRAKEICESKGLPTYVWRVGSDIRRDPSTYSVQRNALTGGVNVVENPGWSKGSVSGVITCIEDRAIAKRGVAPVAAPSAPAPMKVVDVSSGIVVEIPQGSRVNMAASTRFAIVKNGKVDAIAPDGLQVQVDANDAGAAILSGYRIVPETPTTDDASARLAPVP